MLNELTPDDLVNMYREYHSKSAAENIDINSTFRRCISQKDFPFPTQIMSKLIEVQFVNKCNISRLHLVLLSELPEGTVSENVIRSLLIHYVNDTESQRIAMEIAKGKQERVFIPIFVPFIIKSWSTDTLKFYLEYKPRKICKQYIKELIKNADTQGNAYKLANAIKESKKFIFPLWLSNKDPFVKNTRKLNHKELNAYYDVASNFNRYDRWNVPLVEESFSRFYNNGLKAIAGNFMIFRLQLFRLWRNTANRQLSDRGLSVYTHSSGLDKIEDKWQTLIKSCGKEFEAFNSNDKQEEYISKMFTDGKLILNKKDINKYIRVPK